MVENPYRGLPDWAFWRRAVASVDPLDFDPVIKADFSLDPSDIVASAGSCFAQHVAKALRGAGVDVPIFEPLSSAEREAGATPVYSARYANIYSTRQLVQLVERAYGLKTPACDAWVRPDGRLVDPFRPEEFADGFADLASLLAEREKHYAAVRQMLEACTVFIFTLGLTETWVADADGFATPLAPGVTASPVDDSTYSFFNASIDDLRRDLSAFMTLLRKVNPSVRVILTVSPVPLIATYERRHVLVSTTYSKSALRVAAEETMRNHEGVTYFPSYEMVAALPRADAFADDLRSVRPETVERVMGVFKRHFVRLDAAARPSTPAPVEPRSTPSIRVSSSEFSDIQCEEELLDQP